MPLKARNIKRKIDKLFKSSDGQWEQKTTAALGNEAGVVRSDVDGMIYARLRNGETITVYNDVAPEDFDIKVWIGRRKEQPTLWRVIAVRDAYSIPQAPRIKYHAAQHMFRQSDEIPIVRKQIFEMTIIVSDGDSFIVVVYGGTPITPSGLTLVKNQFLNLSAYVPTAGAVFVSVEYNQSGSVSVHAGANFASPDLATTALVPLPDAGKNMIGYVLLWSGMGLLTDDEIVVPLPAPMDRNIIEQNFETINLTLEEARKEMSQSHPGLDIHNYTTFV